MIRIEVTEITDRKALLTWLDAVKVFLDDSGGKETSVVLKTKGLST